jgi:hypothetical protein
MLAVEARIEFELINDVLPELRRDATARHDDVDVRVVRHRRRRRLTAAPGEDTFG